jgi:hypothetical protein
MGIRVFISWSGDRSNKLAVALRDWLPLVLHYAEPWLSEADIQAGDRWGQSVAQELSKSNFGIVCVTQENVNAPWLLFESGALAKSLETSKVVPLLLDLDFSSISGPLAQFQAKKLTRDGLYEVIQSVQASAEDPVPEVRAKQLFNALWPELEKSFAEIPQNSPTQAQARPQNEVLEELVAGVRALDARTPPNRKERRYLRPEVLDDLVTDVSGSEGDPLTILVIATAFQDFPVLYELSVETYRSLVSNPGSSTRKLRRLRRVAEQLGKSRAAEYIGLEPRAVDFATFHLSRLIDVYERKGSRLTVPDESLENA